MNPYAMNEMLGSVSSDQYDAVRVMLASPEKIRSWSHGEVRNPETINYRTFRPERDGLFCERIFGPTHDWECACGKYKRIKHKGIVCDRCGVEVTVSRVRRQRMGHIELAVPVSHIWFFKCTPSRIGTILDIPSSQLERVIYYEDHLVVDPGDTPLQAKQLLSEEQYYEALDKYGDGFKALMGAEAVRECLKAIDLDELMEQLEIDIENTSSKQKRKQISKRMRICEGFRRSEARPEWMTLDVLPVIPPDLRPLVPLDGGRFATSDLNDLYRRVINRNNRLRNLLQLKTPDVIIRNEKRMLQESVDAVFDNGRHGKPVTGAGNRALKSLSEMLKGKTGRFRQNLLGKRVDYSGRSVIVVGPRLKLYQCGLPKKMALTLFEPFIIHRLRELGQTHTVRTARRLIERQDPLVWEALDEVIKGKTVMLNRAPTLHRLSIQSFEPVLIEGEAIQLHPMVCTAFNADFDGDQMAVHVPLSKAAQEEALHLMLASNNILGPKDGKPIVTPSQDMVLGNYYLTLESTKEDFLAKANECRERGDEDEAERYEMYAASEGKVFRNRDEVILAYQTKQIHLHNRIAVPGNCLGKTGFSEEMNNSYLVTTVGKIIFNSIYPNDFPYLNDISKENLLGDLPRFFVPRGTNIREYIAELKIVEPFGKKQLGLIINEIFNRYGTSKTSVVLDKMKDQGFAYSTVAGITVSIADMTIIEGKEELIAEGDRKVDEINRLYRKGLLTEQERYQHVVAVWGDRETGVLKQVEKLLKIKMANETRNPMFMMSASGARGNTSNFLQLVGMRGLMAKPTGEPIELPIKSCFRQGMNVSEFFIATHGARKGGADTALKTADSGYLTRRLVDISQDVIVREDDCHTDHGFVVSEIRDTSQDAIIVPLFDRLVGRYTVREVIHPETGEVIVGANYLMDEEDAKAIINAGITRVEIRSLFGCETKDGVCKHCYGRNLATGKVVEIGEAVGIMAAQSIGEPGTQLTMRTFHTGGVAGGDITMGLPRVQELFEARTPKGESVISEITGEVVSISENGGRYTVVVRNELEEKNYLTNFGARLRVKVGQFVKNGEKITEGTISPKKLLEVADVTEVQKYILKEVQKVYRSQGISISDKHIEVIVRQMLRKLVIVEGGDTEMLPGTRVDMVDFTEQNEIALLEGRRPAVARPLVLGITKAALETDSFLSAASFQETTRVLTDAAIRGKIDILHGLKENVITGKLIPAGTGLRDADAEEEILEDFDVEETMDEVKRQYIEN